MKVPSNVVECLKCSEHYPEFEETVKVCPHCGNTDMMNTIYLSPDGELYPDRMEFFTIRNAIEFIKE